MEPDVKPELKELIENIRRRNTYYGNTIPESIMRLFEIIEQEYNAGILVPFWISTLQKGRGPRVNTKDHGLWKRIYAWMASRNLFTTTTEKGRINEAKSVTWYINKFGNKQFRNKTFVDVYETERLRTIEKINQKFGNEIRKITVEIL